MLAGWVLRGREDPFSPVLLEVSQGACSALWRLRAGAETTMHAATSVDRPVVFSIPYNWRLTSVAVAAPGAALGAIMLWCDSVRLHLIFGYRFAIHYPDETQHVGEQAAHR